jgi:N utilization substance protein A
MLELLAAVEARRGIPLSLLLEAVEEALTVAARVEFDDANIVVTVDRQTGSASVFTRLEVVDRVTDGKTQVALRDVADRFQVGDFVDEPIAPQGFSRLAALTAREVVAKRVIEFERERVYSKFHVLEGTLLHGLVQRADNGHVYALLDAENEAFLPRDEYLGLTPSINDWVYVVVETVRKTARGPAIVLSRASARFVAALLPKWNVVAVARDPGTRTLVAVELPDGVSTPELSALVGAQVELGEPVAWCRWSADPATFVASAVNALGDDCPFVLIEPGAAIVAPIDDAHADLIGRLCSLRIIATEDVVGARAALETERLAFSMEHTVFSEQVDRAEPLALNDAQMAELLRFRDEHQTAG